MHIRKAKESDTIESNCIPSPEKKHQSKKSVSETQHKRKYLVDEISMWSMNNRNPMYML